MLIDKSCNGRFFWGVLIALFFTFAFQSIYAQGSGSIKGQVVDSETGEPLIGANVVIVNTSLGIAADINGEYYLRYVPAGKRTIKVSSLGYATATKDIEVADGANITNQIFRLTPQTITGEAVTVTAQARGQDLAINQQLASNTISNIVSADRIKELPDASAAESIGRLPGVSIDRYNGEATSVAIRGLAPKYNTVTVNGIALPATNNNDRSVDLSLISSNVLDGIEVKKANTPDMDADALGGTIDLRLKKAPEEFKMNVTAQGGYAGLNKYYGNYSGIFGVSDRFFDNKLGVIFSLNADKNNRDADKMDAAYNANAGSSGAIISASAFTINTFTLRRDDDIKNRVGSSLLLDYIIPYGEVTANGFYNQGTTSGTYRSDQLSLGSGHLTHYYSLDDNSSTTSLYTGSLGVMQDFGWMKYDASIASSGSKTSDPSDYQWQFSQEDNAVPSIITAQTPLTSVSSLLTNDSTKTGLKSIYIFSTWLYENQKTAQFNLQIPFTFSNQINGYIKTGGKFKWLTRTFNQEQNGRDNLQYGGAWTGFNSDLIHALVNVYPNDFSMARDSTLIKQTGYWNLYRFYNGYTVPSNFLGGQYKGFGQSPDLRLMHELTTVAQTLDHTNDWQRQSIGSLGYDYDGIEDYQAGYIMAELHVGSSITLIPGVRYDADWTKYHGQSFQDVTSAGSTKPPNNLTKNENIRSNHFWLPDIHLKLEPFDWMRIHLAGTETVTRPDYNNYAPISTLDQYSANIQAANGSLRDSRSKNLDANLSLTNRYFGLLAISGFYKSIDDLVMYEGINGVDTVVYKTLNAQLNVLPGWLSTSPKINTWINNPTPAQYRGVEFEWQTNFWFLPQPFSGLIFNVNWTYINSTVTTAQYGHSITLIRIGHIQTKQYSYDTTYRTQRMPDQPAHILNTTFGYEYKGFSIRASYIYQSDKITGIGSIPELDTYTAAYNRWDLAVQQKLGSSLQLYANLNNLTNTHDESDLGFLQANVTDLSYYGLTVDVGLRFSF
jgi:TonB-dependent receptor